MQQHAFDGASGASAQRSGPDPDDSRCARDDNGSQPCNTGCEP